MTSIFNTIIFISLSGSTIFLFLFSLLFITKKFFSPKWHFKAFKINMLCFLFPIYILILKYFNYKQIIIPNNTFNLYNWKESYSSQNNHINLIIFIWILGSIIFILWNTYCFFKFKKKICTYNFSINNNDIYLLLNKCKEKLHINRTVYIKENIFISSPMIIGIFKPTILLPKNLFDIDNLEPILTHELVHLKRHDILIKLINVIILSLHWFNPIIHMLNKTLNNWCEISCDEEVTKYMSHEERRLYGLSILKVIRHSINCNNGLFISFCSNKNFIELRLSTLLNQRKFTSFSKFFSIALLNIICISTFFCVGLIDYSLTNTTLAKFDSTGINENSIDEDSYSNDFVESISTIHFNIDSSNGIILDNN